MARKTTNILLLSGLLGLLLVDRPARAVVNQVDGLVVPVQTATTCPGDTDKCIQTGINYGEGNNPPTTASGVDAVLDANTGPETFLVPKSGSTHVKVTFRLLQEGAGFENIFGWYNVGQPGKRYPVVFSCRGGNKSTYEPPKKGSGGKLSGGFVATVDFQAEYAKGRYAGKQIGFYLVTPEDTGSSCASDPGDQGTLTSGGPIDDDNSGSATDDGKHLGRIYFTESKLNNDGNYVHYLIYQSAKNAKHYYFGFEDLFRGGDNDYDDTLVKVEGLVPTCQPTAEVCNGVDDNCNSQIDENLFQACSTACGTGKATCKFSNDGNAANDWVNCTAPKPGVEKCNGKDDDCDGTPDNNLGTLPGCTLGKCKGSMVCKGGKLVCGAPKPTTELCDGKDNNCDGKIDENLTRPCSNACGAGIETCKFSDDGNAANDWINCTAPTKGTEVCNGVDDDCDGTVDNNVAGEGQPCDHPSGFTCTKGKTQCVGGKMVCVGATTGFPEVCDCKDNDCNGTIDDNAPCPAGTKCIDCGCRIKCDNTEFGCPKDFACVNGYCLPDKCVNVSCKEGEKCVGGVCVDLCSNITCPSGRVCVKGVCVEDNCYGKGCPAGQICWGGTCVADPCHKVECAAGEFCSDGTCKPSCAVQSCGPGQRCVDGRCRPDPCAGVICDVGVECVDGTCDQACLVVSCKSGRVCLAGTCVDDPCARVTCFAADARCEGGQCVGDRTYGGRRTELLASGSGGVGCVLGGGGPPGGGPAGGGLLALLLAVLAVAARGRKQR